MGSVSGPSGGGGGGGGGVDTSQVLATIPTGSEERGALGVGSIRVAILPSC